MSARNYRLFLLAGLVAAAATGATGCEITKVDCDKTPEEDICQDDPEEDGGDALPDDGDAGKADAGKSDAGKTDAGADGGKSDAGGSDARADSSTDTGGSDGSAEAGGRTLTVQEFCIEQLKVGVAWRDQLEGLCGSMSTAARQSFLQGVLAYSPDDSEDKCIAAVNAAVATNNSAFDGTKAQACADAYNLELAAPPNPFPTTGIDLAMYESKIGHGAQALVQIPSCRATLKGKLTRGKACGGHFECADGLRCLEAPGGTKTCETALIGGTCLSAAQCADGYTCVGIPTSGGGKTCVKTDALPVTGGNCEVSRECATDFVCNSSGKCSNPVASVICK